ncbi:MAG: peroxiredoxin-like family protein [Pseudomonadota bacterium]
MLLTRHAAPALTVPLIGGGSVTLAEAKPEQFTIVVFYRGKHCPLCKKYLQEIDALVGEAKSAGFDVIAVSMDSQERAEASTAEWGIENLRMGYQMDEATARSFGLYISSARAGSTEPARFSEPGLAVVDAENVVFFAQVQSAPFTRPPFADLIGGLKFVVANNYPARGDLSVAA